MINKAAITQVIAQAAVEATKAAVQTTATVEGKSSSGVRTESTSMGPNLGGPTLKQLAFNWSAVDKYMKLKYFRLEVNNTIKAYKTN